MNDHFTVAVTDTGPGIPEEHQARVFEQFHQDLRIPLDAGKPTIRAAPNDDPNKRASWATARFVWRPRQSEQQHKRHHRRSTLHPSEAEGRDVSGHGSSHEARETDQYIPGQAEARRGTSIANGARPFRD
jgi:hypothetical protein